MAVPCSKTIQDIERVPRVVNLAVRRLEKASPGEYPRIIKNHKKMVVGKYVDVFLLNLRDKMVEKGLVWPEKK